MPKKKSWKIRLEKGAKNYKKSQIRENYIWERQDKYQGVSNVGGRIKDFCLKLLLPKGDILGEKRK